MTIACPKCRIEMRCHRQGVAAESMSERGSYQLFMADLYECGECKVQILAGFGAKPLAEHFEAGYQDEVARFPLLRRYQFWLNQVEKHRYDEMKEAALGQCL